MITGTTGQRTTDDERETGSMRVTSMQVGTLRVQSRAFGNSCTKGLLIVRGLIDGKEIEAVVDTGPHSLLSDLIVQELGLDIQPCDIVIKAVNSKAVPVSGITTTDLCVGLWQEKCDLVVVGLDDFDLILGNDFLFLHRKKVEAVKAVPSSYSSSRDGEHSPHIEEMEKKWAEAQQELVAGLGKTASEILPKKEKGYEGQQSDDVDCYEKVLMRDTSNGKVSKVTPMRALTPVSGGSL
ncbi:hypothetical protein Salat_0616100 [Sesamum alatum]|uniref:Uncharacterized protein n=1 Tax=Sesamum alatum TaxID=300844 RepID=A0AAE1YRW6_9LAMI|nr:hypothetical protein Salat_0616100 [Sesamum alatum]